MSVVKRISLLSVALVLFSCQNMNKVQEDVRSLDSLPAKDSTIVPQSISVNDIEYALVEHNGEKVYQNVTLWEVDLPDGTHRKFNQEGGDLYWLKAVDEKVTLIPTPYDRYDDGNDFYSEGVFEAFHYTVSPDSKYLYVTAAIHANSNGWTTEYQLYKINAQTLECKMIAECAAIKVMKKGFRLADCRLANEETAMCTADEIWLMHDVHLNWEGDTIKIEKEEYDYGEMEKRYPAPKGEDEWVRLTGFQRKYRQ